MNQVQRIGEILVARGVLTSAQVEMILARQRELPQPFGPLAKSMFSIPEQELWQAWAEQMLAFLPSVDLSLWPSTSEALSTIKLVDARRHHVLPLRLENGILRLATAREHLGNVVAWAQENLEQPLDFVIAETAQIDAAIGTRYPQHTKSNPLGNNPTDHATSAEPRPWKAA